MKFRLFDLTKPLPFAQGYAINELNRQVAGKLVAAGEAAEDPHVPGTLLLIRKTYSKGEVRQSESVWHDDGLSLQCRYQRTDDNPWQERTPNGWMPTTFTVEMKDAA